MQQHPVPQNITGFEFKLIGFLTIKQFAYLAVAGVFSFIFFISPLPTFLKIVVITPFALIGIALAFVPINGLPFDKWIVVFIHSIYAPSRRVWHKTPKELSFLSPSFSNYLKRPKPKGRVAVGGNRTRLETYLANLRKREKGSKLDIFEEGRLSKLDFASSVPHFRHEVSSGVQKESNVRPSNSNGESV
jgi:hypothetical protein